MSRAVAAVLVVGLAACGLEAGRGGTAGVEARRAALSFAPLADGIDMPVLGSAPFPLRTAGAFDGQGFFLAWDTDMRGVDTGIAATRVSASGVVLDEINLRVPQTPAYTPDVAFGGGVYMLAFDGGQSAAVARRIRVVRFSPAGVLLDQTPVLVNTFVGDAESPAIDFDGTRFLVVWAESATGGSSSIHGARVTPNGAVVDTMSPQLVAAFPSTGYASPQLVFDGADHVIAWAQTGGVSRFVRVSPELVVRDAAPVAIGGGAAEGAQLPALASDGNGFLVAWREANAAAGGSALRAQLYAQDGTARSQPVTIDPAKANEPSLLNATFDGTVYALAWSRGPSGDEDAFTARIDAAGVPVGGVKTLATTGEQWGPTVVGGGGRDLVGWSDDRTLREVVLGSDGATLSAPARAALSVAKEMEPVPVANASGFAVAWRDTRDGRDRIYAALLDQNAAPLAPNGMRLADDPYQRASSVALGAGSARYLAVWDSNTYTTTTLHGRLIGGGAPGPEFELSPRNIREPAVAFGGGVYLVAGTYNYFKAGAEIEALRVSEAGAVLDATPLVLASSPNLCTVASDGTGFLVAWGAGGVVGQRVAANGQLVDAAPLALSPEGAAVSGTPAVAYGAGEYLVTWVDSGASGVVAARVNPDGTPVDQTVIKVSTGGPGDLVSLPTAAFDGTAFVVSWLNISGTSSPQNKEYRYATVTPQGVAGTVAVMAVLDGRDLPLRGLGLAGAGGGRLLATYQRLEHFQDYDVPRVRLRYITPAASPIGARCAAASGCAAGATCIDGVCCQTTCGGGTPDCQGCSVLVGAAQNGMCGPVADGLSCGTGSICKAGVCTVVSVDAGADAGAKSDAVDVGTRDVTAETVVPPSDTAADEPSTNADASADAAPDVRDDDADFPSPRDATTGVDAKTPGGSGGCGCDVAGSPAGGACILAAVSAAAALRRRRRRPAPCRRQ